MEIDTTKYHGHPDFYRMTIDEMELHSAKNRDYAREGNPLGNFYRVSKVLTEMGMSISPALVAIVYAMKQLDAAVQMLTHGYEGDVENVDTRLRDVHVYMKLARILHAEEKATIEASDKLSSTVVEGVQRT